MFLCPFSASPLFLSLPLSLSLSLAPSPSHIFSLLEELGLEVQLRLQVWELLSIMVLAADTGTVLVQDQDGFHLGE